MVYPSQYEGFGFPIIEAMMCGCPVITSNRSSMPEVAGDAAMLVNPDSVNELANAMRRVTYDVELRQNLAARGKARAKDFSWERLGNIVLNAYIEAAGKQGLSIG
jgi:glycosyltransferase involved in cell wall biosynthesis